MASTPLPQQRASRSKIKDPSQGFANSDERYPPLLPVGKPTTQESMPMPMPHPVNPTKGNRLRVAE